MIYEGVVTWGASVLPELLPYWLGISFVAVIIAVAVPIGILPFLAPRTETGPEAEPEGGLGRSLLNRTRHLVEASGERGPFR
ncbi:hypothetical protein [Actinocorallia longicatena]|uniref:hypothetical protein n=1 Tax=Actinocorallia longicatena TaxID=111803 RepID=UPI0031DD466F